MNTPPPSVPPEQLEEFIEALQAMRDELIKVSLLLREHLYETDHAGREQARETFEQLIQRAKID